MVLANFCGTVLEEGLRLEVNARRLPVHPSDDSVSTRRQCRCQGSLERASQTVFSLGAGSPHCTSRLLRKADARRVDRSSPSPLRASPQLSDSRGGLIPGSCPRKPFHVKRGKLVNRDQSCLQLVSQCFARIHRAGRPLGRQECLPHTEVMDDHSTPPSTTVRPAVVCAVRLCGFVLVGLLVARAARVTRSGDPATQGLLPPR